MLGRIITALAAALVLMGTLAADALAQPRREREREWVLLGEKEVGFGVDRDVIRVGQSEDWYRDRRFRTLHFVADRSEVYMINVRIVYFNNFAEEYRVDRVIRDGGELAVDLRAESSFIRQIEMVYKARPGYAGRAIVKVYGEPTRGGGGGGGFRPGPGAGRDWEELGCKQVALFGKDRDVISVGRREGRFKAIRLYVRGADVEMRNLRVIYSNGEPDNLDVRHFIRQGERTQPLDLKGWQRSIDRIEMVYKTVPNFKGIAEVCVQGLQ